MKSKIKEIAEDINDYSNIVTPFLSVYNDLNIPKTASTAINFRDASCHYAKLYKAFKNNDESEFISQKASIYEHLYRGIKDTVVFLLYEISERIRTLIKRDIYFIENRQHDLREFYHTFKNTI